MRWHNSDAALPGDDNGVAQAHRAAMAAAEDAKLRDWFAGQALQIALECIPYGSTSLVPAGIAAKAYDIADAMMAERAKRGAR
jgi:hypothetical protein